MRIAYVCGDAGVPVWGTKGCSIHVQQVVAELLRLGHSVDLMARSLGGAKPAVQDESTENPREIPLQRIPKGLSPGAREQRLMELDREVRMQLERYGPYDLVYERHALWSAAAMEYAEDHDTRSILEVNAPLMSEQVAHRSLVNVRDATRLTRRAFAAAQIVVAVSQRVAEYVRRLEDRQSNVHVVPNGVNTDRFNDARQAITSRWNQRVAGLDCGPVVLGFVGTLRPWHGMGVLGEAFRIFHRRSPRSILLVVGDGAARGELIKAVGAPARANVTITGKVPHADVPRLVQQMDIGLAPYPHLDDFYSSPLKVLEYMAAGLPIVSSHIGDIPHVLRHDMTGVLVRPGVSHAFSTACSHLVEAPQRAWAIGQRAAEHARGHTWEHVVRRLLDLVGRRPSDGCHDVWRTTTVRNAG